MGRNTYIRGGRRVNEIILHPPSSPTKLPKLFMFYCVVTPESRDQTWQCSGNSDLATVQEGGGGEVGAEKGRN